MSRHHAPMPIGFDGVYLNLDQPPRRRCKQALRTVFVAVWQRTLKA
jgi:hypothetical protein